MLLVLPVLQVPLVPQDLPVLLVLPEQEQPVRRKVALKVINPRRLGSAEARTRFLEEARSLAALEHDHIVAIYQVGDDRGVPFLAMQSATPKSKTE